MRISPRGLQWAWKERLVQRGRQASGQACNELAVDYLVLFAVGVCCHAHICFCSLLVCMPLCAQVRSAPDLPLQLGRFSGPRFHHLCKARNALLLTFFSKTSWPPSGRTLAWTALASLRALACRRRSRPLPDATHASLCTAISRGSQPELVALQIDFTAQGTDG